MASDIDFVDIRLVTNRDSWDGYFIIQIKDDSESDCIEWIEFMRCRLENLLDFGKRERQNLVNEVVITILIRTFEPEI